MKKTLTVVIALVLVVVMSVAGTVAYLTSQDAVTNTFTVGKVNITLDEAKVDEYGKAVTPAARVDANTYKLIPGQPYTKDPIVHFQPDSEASWLFVKVVNEISDIEDGTTIAAQILANGWTELSGETGVYYKQVPANTTLAAVDYPVFGSFTLKGDANVAAYDGKTVVVTAYAIQAAGFDTPAAAWDEVGN